MPFARYVLENAGTSSSRSAATRSRRHGGEPPQEGRYREFTQADIDVVGNDTLSFHYDVEVALVIAEAIAALPMPPMPASRSTTATDRGLYTPASASDRAGDSVASTSSTRSRRRQVAELLTEAGTDLVAGRAAAPRPDPKLATHASWTGPGAGRQHELLEEGLNELAGAVEGSACTRPGTGPVDADLDRARAGLLHRHRLETVMMGHEHLGSICSGGRYDALAR